MAAHLLLLLAVSSVLSVPARRQADAPFSVDEATLANSVTCPFGIAGAEGGVVLLVHGTAVNATLSWSEGPYVKYLPDEGPGYDVCWVELPDMAVGDAQVTAEYVAYNVPVLADQSATGQVSIIGHSQGAGLTPQWALSFWPSIRPLVSAYVALAPDFHGTGEGLLICTVQQIAQGGCLPAMWQQSVGSEYLKAQNAIGGEALVPTTSIYTVMDDVIQPEVPEESATSQLPGATVIKLQADDVCGPLHIADHFTMLIDGGAYALAVDALAHGGAADPDRIDWLTLGACNDLRGLTALPEIVKSAVTAVVTFTTNEPRVPEEPPLKPYVCDAGAAETCGSY